MTIEEKMICEVKLMPFNTAKKIETKTISGFLFRSQDSVSVNILYDGEKEINDEFVGIKVLTRFLRIDSGVIKVLSLTAKQDVNYSKFAAIASNFMSKENYSSIVADAYAWIDEWKNMFGDAKKNKMVFDVLGELVSLLYIFKKDKTARWEGPFSCSHDIVCQNANFETKSTTNKTEYLVGIHSSKQLTIDKPTSLLFVRFERKPYCLTLNSVINELIREGYSEELIEKGMESEGYPKGCRQRDESFEILEMNNYKITKELFPIISILEINKLAPRENIIAYQLTIDLSSIDHETILD